MQKQLFCCSGRRPKPIANPAIHPDTDRSDNNEF